MDTLELEQVGKSYRGKPVLAGASHVFAPGLSLLRGASGAGKSTLLRLIATAETPGRGRILWNGEPLPRARRALRAGLGYAPQAVDLPEDLSAREFARHIAALKGLALAQADRQFAAIAERIGLHGDIQRPIGSFSGGMRRRLIFAQALLGAPRLIALDEPTAELDRDTAAQVDALILERAAGAIVVMTTHLSERLAQRATVLRVEDGALVGERGRAP